jgi:hypothetical protein
LTAAGHDRKGRMTVKEIGIILHARLAQSTSVAQLVA